MSSLNAKNPHICLVISNPAILLIQEVQLHVSVTGEKMYTKYW